MSLFEMILNELFNTKNNDDFNIEYCYFVSRFGNYWRFQCSKGGFSICGDFKGYDIFRYKNTFRIAMYEKYRNGGLIYEVNRSGSAFTVATF